MDFELYYYLIFFAVALIAGFIDAIAGGGGMITIPTLLACGIPPHLALGTNKLGSVFGSFTAALNFYRQGMFQIKDILFGMFFTFVGAIFGTISVLFIDANILSKILPFMMIAIFLYFLFMPKIGEIDKNKKISENFFYIIFGILIGFYDGFFGPGTGTFWMISIVFFLGYNIKKATARTKVMNFTSNIVSLFVFMMSSNILIIVGLLMGFGQIIGAYFGSNFVIKKDIKFIKTIFLFVVGITIMKLLYENYM